MTTKTEALKRIAAYPFSRAEELSVEQMREIAREALAQPEQEPVAWCVINNGELIEATLYRDYAEEILAGQIEGCGSEIAPLYTTPPQRTWVGLTDEERKDIELGIEVFGTSVEDILKEAEAKLKEKNT